ncbi:MAG: ATP-binding cassette domain-containing protein [Christensenellales bacterium]
MLELKNISKISETKDLKVTALDGISISFRKSEFVSILGPSGCGKTTMLNIVGGLDKYTSGDLVINGKSTKDFSDRDWDSYRNHTIGFVFQSYNLIPHQTVLENVELALTLSGIKKEERHRRATEALAKVGLSDKLKAKPNQLSGGQMQRVAIARALVNDPDIVLADEPTGALDSKTSVQVMELLKEISKDKLVIMVTHNPSLAEEYSSRIIKLLDGKLINDSNPKTAENDSEEVKTVNETLSKPRKSKKRHHSPKTTMSFFTALSLSLKNLLTKKARTFLVAFAGSIGIIGIALVLALSTGFSGYVNRVQEDTLSSHPITIEAQSVSYMDIMAAMIMDNSSTNKASTDNGVESGGALAEIMNKFGKALKVNNLQKFNNYLVKNYAQIQEHVSAIQYTYDIGLEFYDSVNKNVQPYSSALYNVIINYSMQYLRQKTNLVPTKIANGYNLSVPEDGNYDLKFLEDYSSVEAVAGIVTQLKTVGQVDLTNEQVAGIVTLLMNIPISNFAIYNMQIFNEAIDSPQLLKEQYSLVGEGSKWATESNEVMLVLNSDNRLDDYILYALGLVTEEQMTESLTNLLNNQDSTMKVNYSDILGREYKVLTDSDYYLNISTDPDVKNIVDIRKYYYHEEKDAQGNITSSYYDAEFYTKYNEILENCTNKVKIVGVLKPKEDVTNGCLTSGIAYLNLLTQKMIEINNSSLAVESDETNKIDTSTPIKISIYASSFDAKNSIEDFIKNYNKNAKEGDQIEYSNLIGTIMSGVSTIISAITYILIAFVSVSLVVSSIMIGIITYISVLERIKEIGILRSIGASKQDIKRVFTAETLIIGFIAGLLGILVTLILTIPLNLIIKAVAGINIHASLPILAAIILIAISMLLTFIAGLIPSRIASKKDPVVALRTE